jgi:V/A-type H+-transporting ATPase subunit D
MKVDYQYNKITLQKIQNDLSIRERALPILRAKESALRLEVKELKKKIESLEEAFVSEKNKIKNAGRLWNEFPELVKIENVETSIGNIAGVKILQYNTTLFHDIPFDVFVKPAWFLEGVTILKTVFEKKVALELEYSNLKNLMYATKKTTQKVNLYEKVQMPFFMEAISKIKRFLEDEENLSKASQKILKRRKAS